MNTIDETFKFIKNIKQIGFKKALWEYGLLNTVLLTTVILSIVTSISIKKSSEPQREPASKKNQKQQKNH